MRVAQEQVQNFHEKMSYPVGGEKPELIEPDLAKQRYEFIREELHELGDAMKAGDLVAIADALADLQYVILGAAVCYGIDMQPVFEEVHRSNMTKTPLDPVTKKGGKGEGYQPPRLAEILLIQSLGYGHGV